MEITIKTSEPLLGFKTKHRQKINFHDFRFWYKAILGIGILTLVIACYAVIIAQIYALNRGITDYLIEHNAELGNETGASGSDLQTIAGDLQRILSTGKLGNEFIVSWITDPKWYDQYGTFINIFQKYSYNANGDVTVTFGTTVNALEAMTFYSSYFTTLSNILVGVWLVTAAFWPKNEGTFNRGFANIRWAGTSAVFITITAIVWNFILLPGMIIGVGNFVRLDAWGWVSGFLLHLVGPVLFLVYVSVFMPLKEKGITLDRVKHGYIGFIIVLATYLMYTVARGGIRQIIGKTDPNINYPYPFLDIFSPNVMNTGIPGIVAFVICGGIIVGIAIGFTYLYANIMNYRIAKETGNPRIILKEEKKKNKKKK
ncbi:Pr6Pr family membrane protein, partial [Mesoplasma photuris]|uniref:Pr6Pr family membrane protein n=1 Tax=Mesoplasma photuris TaxID=217731 RepID=UPI0004E0B927